MNNFSDNNPTTAVVVCLCTIDNYVLLIELTRPSGTCYKRSCEGSSLTHRD